RLRDPDPHPGPGGRHHPAGGRSHAVGVPRARAGRPAGGAAPRPDRRCQRPLGLGGPQGGPVLAGRPPVHQRLDGRPQGGDAAPARWMEWMSEHRATATAGPNFAYALAARALRRFAPGTLDLSRWRIALNGAEAVDPKAVADFVAAGAPHGLDPGAVFPAFGMAEATLAVTFPAPGRGLRTDPIERRVLETDAYAAPADPGGEGTRHLVLLGRPVPGLEIRIVDPVSGHVRDEREVGELEIRGSSVTSGYYRR